MQEEGDHIPAPARINYLIPPTTADASLLNFLLEALE